MKLIGITGAIGSGKSALAALLEEKGALLIDADRLAHRAIEPGTAAYQQIVERFGPDILLPDSTIDRRKLGQIVFTDPEKLHILNSIVHPPVMAEVDSILEAVEAQSGDGRVVVADIPLLIEVGFHRRCGLTVVVTADREVRARRLLEKGLPREEVERRIEAQAGKEELEAEADIVIENNGTLEELKRQADALWQRVTAN